MGLCVFGWVCVNQAFSQPIAPVRQFETSGVIKAITDGAVAITDTTGKSWRMKISSREDGAVSLGGARMLLKIPATVNVTGKLKVDSLGKGFPVRFTAKLSRDGKMSGQVTELAWIDDKEFARAIKPARKSNSRGEYVDCSVVGDIESIRGTKMLIRVPRSRFARKGRLSVPLAKDAEVRVESTDLSKVQPGDHVTAVQGVEFSNGELVIRSISVRLGGKVSQQAASTEADAAKYRDYSDEPSPPRPLRSQHFVVHTDMSERNARILLDKLESMIELVSRYFGRPQKGIVECYVVRDLKSWPPALFPPDAKAKIEAEAGMTVSQALGRQIKSIVYSCDKPGVAQHEAVHAYCNQTFGAVGPTWYAEGIAEMGRYWHESQLAVDVDPVVIDYLTKAKEPKKLTDIVAADQITGDSWEAYSWRWALCYLLASNPNYNRNFKALGISLMTKQPQVSFESVYGRTAKQLSFEYDQFVGQVGNGYRADLCAWQWNKKFVAVDKKGHQTIRLRAKAGWQPGSIRVEEGLVYEYTTKGEWKIDGAGAKVDADGNKEGEGKLTAAIMKDYQLSEPIALGKRGRFTATSSGDLYLRCAEEWTRLGDNSGTMTAYIRLAKQQKEP